MRLFGLLMSTCLVYSLGLVSANASFTSLPDMGSSAQKLLTPAQQARYGALMLAQLNSQGVVITDPQLTAWLQEIGLRLQSHSNQPSQFFSLFLLRDRQINAFATLGGYIAINAGLILTTENESEFAAVLAHEMAHVTQHHVLRSVERAQRDQLPVVLGLLAMIAAAQQSHSTSRGDATMAGISGALGLLEQRQINYTRSQEAEADRLGIRTLALSGYDPFAMATFFQRLQWSSRADEAGEQTPDFLRSHPLTSTRISEAKTRAEQLEHGIAHIQSTWPSAVYSNRFVDPLLPSHWQFSPRAAVNLKVADHDFAWAKERVRVLTTSNLTETIHNYEKQGQQKAGKFTPQQLYGLALARVLGHENVDKAITQLQQLAHDDPTNRWVALLLAQALDQNGQQAAADQQLESLLRKSPGQAELTLLFAQILNGRATPSSGRQAERLLRPLIPAVEQDLTYIETYARACELSGNEALASEAYAEVTYLRGFPERALMQLNALTNRHLDYTLRTRIEAKIAEITPEVLEMRRRGIHDSDLEP